MKNEMTVQIKGTKSSASGSSYLWFLEPVSNGEKEKALGCSARGILTD
jgi:hypothetical protein